MFVSEFIDVLLQFVKRNIDGAGDVPDLEFNRFAQVDNKWRLSE